MSWGETSVFRGSDKRELVGWVSEMRQVQQARPEGEEHFCLQSLLEGNQTHHTSCAT